MLLELRCLDAGVREDRSLLRGGQCTDGRFRRPVLAIPCAHCGNRRADWSTCEPLASRLAAIKRQEAVRVRRYPQRQFGPRFHTEFGEALRSDPAQAYIGARVCGARVKELGHREAAAWTVCIVGARQSALERQDKPCRQIADVDE